MVRWTGRHHSDLSSYLQERPLHPQDLHGICVSQDLEGIRCLRDSFDFLVDLSQDLIEEDVLDVHGEELTERTLFGRAELHGVLYLLDKSGKHKRKNAMWFNHIVKCVRVAFPIPTSESQAPALGETKETMM